MAIWSMLSAPLLMSNNLALISPELKNVLINRKVIAVDQDSLGIMGKRIYKSSSEQIWVKPMTPVNDDNKASFAIVYLNLEDNEKIVSIFVYHYHCYYIIYICNVQMRRCLCVFT